MNERKNTQKECQTWPAVGPDTEGPASQIGRDVPAAAQEDA